MLPRKGETIDISEYIDAGIIKDFKNKKYKRRGQNTQMEFNLYDIIYPEFPVIKEICWQAKYVEIQLKLDDRVESDAKLYEAID